MRQALAESGYEVRDDANERGPGPARGHQWKWHSPAKWDQSLRRLEPDHDLVQQLGLLERHCTRSEQGVQPLLYTLGDDSEMPDLDDASEVVLAGASAGGNGVQHHLDRVAQTLRQQNNHCKGGPCPLKVAGIIDSATGPDLETLDFSSSTACLNLAIGEVCARDVFIKDDIENGSVALWRTRSDDSCPVWHHSQSPGTDWECADLTHVIRHHITTPFFVRMGQADSLISSGYIDLGFSTQSDGLPLTLVSFAGLVREQLQNLSLAVAAGHEGEAIAVPPGVFVPACSDHETLSSNVQVYGVLIESGGTLYAMSDVLLNWRNGTSPSTVVFQPGTALVCPS